MLCGDKIRKLITKQTDKIDKNMQGKFQRKATAVTEEQVKKAD